MVKKGKVARSETFRCYVIDCRNIGLHPSTREKRKNGVFKNQIPLRRAFRLKSGYMYHWIDVRGKPLLRKKIVKFVIFNKPDGKGQGILFPAVWGTHFFWSRFKEEVKVKIL